MGRTGFAGNTIIGNTRPWSRFLQMVVTVSSIFATAFGDIRINGGNGWTVLEPRMKGGLAQFTAIGNGGIGLGQLQRCCGDTIAIGNGCLLQASPAAVISQYTGGFTRESRCRLPHQSQSACRCPTFVPAFNCKRQLCDIPTLLDFVSTPVDIQVSHSYYGHGWYDRIPRYNPGDVSTGVVGTSRYRCFPKRR